MIKIAINGFGRIGRQAYKKILENHPDLEIVAINDLTDKATLEHLLKYDSIYSRYDGKIDCVILAEKDPENLPWKKMAVDIVLECTGLFTDLNSAEKHIKVGSKKVIISAPAKDEAIPSYVLGVNEEKYNPEKDNIIDMGSCTTNCLAPMAKILNDNFKITKGFMTTIHSYTNDQRILDLPHKDLRRARAAAINLIPTSTGAAKAIGKVIPELKGKLDGLAFRVPVASGSVTDFVCELEKSTTKGEINKVFNDAAKKLKGILEYTTEPLVSVDIITNPNSAIFDSELTNVIGGNFVKVIAWYDNEWGFSERMIDVIKLIGK